MQGQIQSNQGAILLSDTTGNRGLTLCLQRHPFPLERAIVRNSLAQHFLNGLDCWNFQCWVRTNFNCNLISTSFESSLQGLAKLHWPSHVDASVFVADVHVRCNFPGMNIRYPERCVWLGFDGLNTSSLNQADVMGEAVRHVVGAIGLVDSQFSVELILVVQDELEFVGTSSLG